MRNIAKMAMLAREKGDRNRGNEYNGTYTVDIGTYNADMRRRDSRGRYAEMDDGPEMRRRRDSRGRYMEDDDGPEMRGAYNAGDIEPESRFRDRREHYDNGRFAPRNEERHDQDTWDYSPEERRANMYALPRPAGLIGFMGQDERRMEHGEHRKQEQHMGYSRGMRPFDHEMAKEWTGMMKNADGTMGAHWTKEQTKPYMSQIGYKGDEAEFWAIMNAMYSDYCAVLKKFGVDRPEVYAALAKAWIEDKDAVKDKAAIYYECIVEHD